MQFAAKGYTLASALDSNEQHWLYDAMTSI
jgi:hypothetical protein